MGLVTEAPREKNRTVVAAVRMAVSFACWCPFALHLQYTAFRGEVKGILWNFPAFRGKLISARQRGEWTVGKLATSWRISEEGKRIVELLQEWYGVSAASAIEIALRVAQRAGPPAGKPLERKEAAELTTAPVGSAAAPARGQAEEEVRRGEARHPAGRSVPAGQFIEGATVAVSQQPEYREGRLAIPPDLQIPQRTLSDPGSQGYLAHRQPASQPGSP